MNKYVTELIGTFFLVLTIGCTVIPGPELKGVIPPLAIGSILMVMIFAGGHISGAHYNPAVTLGVWVRGRCDTKDVVPYLVFQVIGAVLAALAAQFLRGNATAGGAPPGMPKLLLAELLYTFALVYVVVNVATAKGTSGNSFFGLAIGFTVLAGAFAVGDISGGVFNPAVAVGAAIMGVANWANIWLHIAAELVAGAAAGAVFKLLNPADK